MCLPAVFLVLTGYVGCDQVLAVVMISAAIGFAGISMAGYGVNHIDIAPPFAGKVSLCNIYPDELLYYIVK